MGTIAAKGANGSVTLGESANSSKIVATIVGDGTTKAFTVAHKLGTRAIFVSVQKSAAEVPTESELSAAFVFKALDTEKVEVIFTVAPGAGVQLFAAVFG